MVVGLESAGRFDGMRPLRTQHFMDPDGPRFFTPLEANGSAPMIPTFRKVHLVGARNESRGRVYNQGQSVWIEKPRPLISTIARDREETIPIRAQGRVADGEPGDGPRPIRVDLVHGRRAPAAHRVSKLLEIARPHA